MNTIKVIVLILICISSLAGCSHKKTPEQEHKEQQFMEICAAKHMGDDKVTPKCKKEFKAKYGYPYKLPNSDLDK